jgi:hypothetical protein
MTTFPPLTKSQKTRQCIDTEREFSLARAQFPTFYRHSSSLIVIFPYFPLFSTLTLHHSGPTKRSENVDMDNYPIFRKKSSALVQTPRTRHLKGK